MADRILITGGSGAVASLIRPLLAREGREVLLLDISEPSDPCRAGERFLPASVTDLDAVTDACAGVDVIVHLAGFASERPWPEILDININGTWCVLEAARRAGAQRVLLASSIHAVGFATAEEARDAVELVPRPDTYYGVGKVAMEALGRLYADRFAMTVVSARLGTVEAQPSGTRSLSTWVSPADLVRLIGAVSVAEPGGSVIWAISDNTRRWVSLDAGRAIGFDPVDDADAFAESLGFPDALPPSSRLGADWAEALARDSS